MNKIPIYHPESHVELWLTLWGDLIETVKNPCGCCPDSYTIEYFYKPKRSLMRIVSIDFANRKDFIKHMCNFNRKKLM